MKVLVCGLGSIGRRHLHLLVERLGIHSICAVEPCSQRALAADNPHGLRVYTTLREGLAWGPELVWMCTPNHLHIPMALEIFESSSANLFVEKPVGEALCSSLDLVRAYKKSPRLVFVACNMRFHPGVRAVRNVLEKDLIGRPLVVRIHFAHYLPNWRPGQDYRQTYSAKKREGGGVILDDIHDLDLAAWVGGPVKNLCAMGGQSGILDTDVEEFASINLLHENGIFTHIYMDYLRREKSRGIEVIGESGTVTWVSSGKNPENIRVDLYDSKGGMKREILSDKHLDSNLEYRLQRDEVLHAIEHPETWEMHLKLGLSSLALAEAAKRSLGERRWIEQPQSEIDAAFR